MGFTRHWIRNLDCGGGDADAYRWLACDARRIIDTLRTRMVPHGPDPAVRDVQIDGIRITFDGDGETFHWPLTPTRPPWLDELADLYGPAQAPAFCKTHRTTYDIAVAAILLRATVRYPAGAVEVYAGDGDVVPAAAVALNDELFGPAEMPAR